MAAYRRLEISQVPGAAGSVTVARFVDHRIIETAVIEELGDELLQLGEEHGSGSIVLNFADVEFLSSTMLNKLIRFGDKVKGAGGKLRLCGIHPVILEVFQIAALDRRFEIKPTQEVALQGF